MTAEERDAQHHALGPSIGTSRKRTSGPYRGIFDPSRLVTLADSLQTALGRNDRLEVVFDLDLEPTLLLTTVIVFADGHLD